MNVQNYPMHVSIVVTSAAQLAGVYALLGGAAPAAIGLAGAGSAAAPRGSTAEQAGATVKDLAQVQHVDQTGAAPKATGGAAVTGEAAATGEDGKTHDAAGTPFDPKRHTGTTVKSGLWRMKAGVPRGPGEGEDSIPATGTAASGAASNAGASASTGTAPAATVDEEDEFAAFTKAAGASTASTTARTWTDADLSKLSNQAAQKLGGERVGEIKSLIGQYVPEGTVPHSRNIPADKREAFAKALEAHAGIEYNAAA